MKMNNALQPPPPFCFDNDLANVTTGNISREWSRWKNRFIIYMKAIKLDKETADVQINVLLHVVGEKCQEIFEQFNEQFSTAERLLAKFDNYFSGKKNLTIERQKFFGRSQVDCESIEQYINELSKLSLSCEFQSLREDLVKDRLIYGIKDDGLRERLLREQDLTLTKTVEICKLAEMSRAQASFIKRDNLLREQVNAEENIHAVQRSSPATGSACMCSCAGNASRAGSGKSARPAFGARGGGDGAGGERAVTSSRRLARPAQAARAARAAAQWQRAACSRCGTVHSQYECPAYGKICRNCNRPNHFAKMCRAGRVHAVQEDSSDRVCQNSLFFKNSDWVVDVSINNYILKIKLDTGADVNVLPCKFLSKIGINKQSIVPTCTKLLGYSGTSIEVLGKCSLKVKYKNNYYILKFIVANVNSVPILGRQSCEELNVVHRVLGINAQIKSSILDEFEDVFQGMGCLPGEYRIQLKDNITPVIHAPRKLPIALRDSVKQKLDELVEQGIIAKVEGPTDWVNSMTVVKKPDGDIRICLDPKDLNKFIKREHFKLPTLEEITSRLSGANFFSTLDAKQSFFQVKLHNSSTSLCTFNTAFGRYKFLRMPFGISSASEIFHKKLYEFFDDIDGVILFVDDLLVFGPTRQVHDERLRRVLQRCREINIKLNKNKCKIGLTELKYLGHKISKNGISPDDSHTTAVQNMPTPKNVKDLERFLGLINYVGNFISNLSEKTHLLRELLKKNIEWHWDERHDNCFNELKKCLVSPPVLRYYSLQHPVTVSVDASKHGLGACLMQDGAPVCYASKSLTETEQRYAQIEKELYACVFACEKFYAYIYGRDDVVIETDHKPLVSIIQKPIADAPARLQRMLLRLQPYSFKLTYKPGKYLYVADTLSRAVAPAPMAGEGVREHWAMRAQVCAVAVSNPLTDTHFLELQRNTKVDEEMQSLIKIIRKGWPDHKNRVECALRPYWDFRDELTVAFDMVWKGAKIVIPKCMRKDMLFKIHAGHLGVEKCKNRAREIMFWPSMNSQIADMVSHCQACLTYRKQNNKESLIPHKIPSRAWSKLGVDIFHFAGRPYLIVIDYFSKYIEVNKLNTMTSLEVIDNLKNIFSRQGIPEILMSDNGPEFNSSYFKCFETEWKFRHITSSPRYPQSNGQVERAVQIVKNMLKKTHYDQTDFRLALLEYSNSPISADLASPAQLLNNRSLRGILPRAPAFLEPKVVNKEIVKQQLHKRQIYQKHYYDKTSKKLKELMPGDKVKVFTNGIWSNGLIINKIDSRSFHIKMCTGRIIRRNRRHVIKDSEYRNESYVSPYDGDDFNVDCQTLSPRARVHVQDPSTQSLLGTNRESNNLYVTKFGRTVRPPERYGYP